MSDCRLIALDIDGTTIARGESISDENRRWILEAKRQGVDVTFATGRHRLGLVAEYVQDLQIEVPFVTLNGGEVWTPTQQLLARHALDSTDVQFLYDLAVQYDTHFWGATTEAAMNRHNFLPPSQFDTVTWIKFGYYTEDVSVLAHLWAELESKVMQSDSIGKPDSSGQAFSLSNSDPFNIEVNAAGATKAAGLQTVVDYLGIRPSQVAVMGDSLNDLSMFEWAGLAIAMENAQESVKHVAHQITSKCEEDGVARAIQGILNV